MADMKPPDASIVAANVERTELRTRLTAWLEAGNSVDSVAEMGKSAYAQVALLKNALAPHEATLEVVQEVLTAYLVKRNRSLVNDSEFRIELEAAKKTPNTNETKLYDMLHALVIDGSPLPEEALKEAAYIAQPPPPPPMKKTNLTKIKPLIKQFGAQIQECLDACVEYVEKPRRLIFTPKEKLVGAIDRYALASAASGSDSPQDP